MHHRVCTAYCFRTWIRPEVAMNSLVQWGHRFCSADGGSHSLCSLSSATVCRAIEWAIWLPWLDRLKATFRGEWDYELDALLRHSWRSVSKTGNALCCLKSSQPTTQVPWPNRATSVVPQTVRSVCSSLVLSTAGLHSFQELSQSFWSDGTGRRSPQGMGLWLSTLPGGGQTRFWVWQNSLFEDPNQTDLYPAKSPGQSVLGSADKQSCLLELLLGHYKYELYLPRYMYWLL